MILGLDVSTSVVGITILDEKGRFVHITYCDLRKEKDFFKKTMIIREKLKDVLEFPITEIYIEDIMQSFSGGMSSAKTITQLARFNGIVSYIAYELSGLTPVYLNVNSIRKTLGIKIDKNSSIEKKEQVRIWVDNHLQNQLRWPTKTLKSGPRKGETILSSVCYDMADSFAVALAGYNQK